MQKVGCNHKYNGFFRNSIALLQKLPKYNEEIGDLIPLCSKIYTNMLRRILLLSLNGDGILRLHQNK